MMALALLAFFEFGPRHAGLAVGLFAVLLGAFLVFDTGLHTKMSWANVTFTLRGMIRDLAQLLWEAVSTVSALARSAVQSLN